MGSSEKAGNKGIPATPREGAPIEMTALLKHCLDFVSNDKNYPYKSVIARSGQELYFVQWADRI